MPRKNKRKPQPYFHGATLYDKGFNTDCYGCAFAGKDFKCTTSDGKCLKSKSASKERDNAAIVARTD